MTLDDFMGLDRLPTSDELAALCDELGIGFGTDPQGNPVLKANGENRAEGVVLAKLLRREPWRSQVIARRLNESKPDKTPDDWKAKEPAPAEPDERPPAPPRPDVPRDSTVVVADARGRCDGDGEPYMWTWTGAESWYMVKDYPVPQQR